MQGKKGTRGVRTYRERVWEQVHLSARIAKRLSATDDQLWSWYPQCLLMVLTAFWFHHHKGVKREFRIIRFVLNILRTTNRYVQRLIAKKTLTVRKGAAYKPRWREASKPPETWVVVGKILLGSPHLACCHSLGVTRFLYVMWRRKPACRSHVRRQGRYLELTQTTPEILP